jgi:hypothetical protein
MNLIILSKIPSFVLALIIIEVVIMVGLGGFLIFDIVKGKLKERKKKREEEEAFKREAREKSISLDSQEDTYLDTGMSELEYLRKMTLEQREYIDALEKRISLTEEIENQNVHQKFEYVDENEPINEDEGFNEFWDSIPVKEGVILEDEEEPTEEQLEEHTEEQLEELTEEQLEEPLEAMEEPAEESVEEAIEELEDTSATEDAFDEAEDLNANPVQKERDPNEPMVFTASSLKAVGEDPLEQKRKQEKIQAFLRSYKDEEEVIEEEQEEDIEYDLVEPWYCQAKPFIKKKKRYNNY